MCPQGSLILDKLKADSRAAAMGQGELIVDAQRNCRRWFEGSISVHVWQTDGAEITD